MNQLLFNKGQVYTRMYIHNLFGGNPQAGISTSGKFPYIFIFSGKAGSQHGYKNQWENSNVFSYTGEGQHGNMEFVRGNLALRDHLKTGKRVFLFSETLRSRYQFEDEVFLETYNFFNSPDNDGMNRVAIKFFFRRINSPKYQLAEDVPAIDLQEGSDYNKPNITERKGLVTSRVGQGAYRTSILYRWNHKCAVTGYSNPKILIASHIHSWKDSTDEQRLDVNNGILLSPVFDALFDQHLISFENNGKIILSDNLLKTPYRTIGITGKEVIKSLNSDNHFYLQIHREKQKG